MDFIWNAGFNLQSHKWLGGRLDEVMSPSIFISLYFKLKDIIFKCPCNKQVNKGDGHRNADHFNYDSVCSRLSPVELIWGIKDPRIGTNKNLWGGQATNWVPPPQKSGNRFSRIVKTVQRQRDWIAALNQTIRSNSWISWMH